MTEALRVNTGSVIGLDIGGTKIAAGLVSFPEARVLTRRQCATRPQRAAEQILDDVLTLVAELSEFCRMETGRSPDGIGAGVAELVDHDGNVTSSQTIPWRGFPVRECLSRFAPSVVESDVRAAATGEALLGAGKEYELVVYVTIGTGISYSLVIQGLPYAGARGNALVLASGTNMFECEHCGRENHFTLEEFASGPAIASRYMAARGRRGIRGEDVVLAAEAGDSTALGILSSAERAVGAAIGWLVNILDPEMVIIGGGLGLSGGEYWRSLEVSTRDHIWAGDSRDIPILPAALGRDSGLIGAAATYWKSRCDARRKGAEIDLTGSGKGI